MFSGKFIKPGGYGKQSDIDNILKPILDNFRHLENKDNISYDDLLKCNLIIAPKVYRLDSSWNLINLFNKKDVFDVNYTEVEYHTLPQGEDNCKLNAKRYYQNVALLKCKTEEDPNTYFYELHITMKPEIANLHYNYHYLLDIILKRKKGNK